MAQIGTALEDEGVGSLDAIPGAPTIPQCHAVRGQPRVELPNGPQTLDQHGLALLGDLGAHLGQQQPLELFWCLPLVLPDQQLTDEAEHLVHIFVSVAYHEEIHGGGAELRLPDYVGQEIC